MNLKDVEDIYKFEVKITTHHFRGGSYKILKMYSLTKKESFKNLKSYDFIMYL